MNRNIFYHPADCKFPLHYRANQDLETMTQKHQQENAKLKAIIKKLEVKSKSLEETLEQKVKENQALTAICDELINKVGD